MTARLRLPFVAALACGLAGWPVGPAHAEPAHAIAMYGTPALAPDFAHLPQVNPEAPTGGRIVFAEVGTFNSLNPYVLRGSAPWGVNLLTVQSLMGRSFDEPFTLYGVLAESVHTNPARDFVEFTLREEARFSDGSPVTVADVMWSMQTLGTDGHPRFHAAWGRVASMEATGPRTVRFTFTGPDRELPLLLGIRPILKKAQFDGVDFNDTALMALIGSGPYVVGQFEPGRVITFRRDPDWWGHGLAFFAGQHNFDEVRYEYFADATVAFEQFKAGEIMSWREPSAARWADSFDFPRVRSGEVVLSEIAHERPSGMTGLAFNIRRPMFSDWRVREAMIQAFNFEQISQVVNGGADPRIASPFSNSVLGMEDGPAQGRVAALLEPWRADLPPGALEGYRLPVSDGSVANRANMRAATALLAEAGWEPDAAGVLRNAAGDAFAFTILLRQGAGELRAITDIYVEALRRLGMRVDTATVDSAQFNERMSSYDFDMTHVVRAMSLSPGLEQWLYWGSEAADTPGTRNVMGVRSPAIDALIEGLLMVEAREDFVATAQALDRVLMAQRLVVPLWFAPVSRLAHDRRLRFPDRIQMYGDWVGFQPEVWWFEE